MTPCGVSQAISVAAGGSISMLPFPSENAVWYVLQPDEPVSVPSSANFAVMVVPGSGLVTASPLRNAVTSQSPSGDASSYRSTSLWSSSARTRSEPSTCHAATRPRAAR